MENTNLTIIAKNFLYYDINTESGNDITIIGIGQEACSPNKYEGPKVTACYSLHVVLKGSGTLKVKNRLFTVEANQIFVIPPNVEVEYYPTKEDPWEYIWISFSGPMGTKLCNRCGIFPDTPVFKPVPPEAKAIALSCVNLHKMTFGTTIAAIGHLYNLFSIMIETICKEQATTMSMGEQYILQAIRYIQENYSNPKLSLKDVSDKIGLNYNYTSQLFKKVTGNTIMQYLNLFRIQRACELLDMGNHYIKDVSQKVGFTDQLYFSKIFKKLKNISPKYYNSTTELTLTEN